MRVIYDSRYEENPHIILVYSVFTLPTASGSERAIYTTEPK